MPPIRTAALSSRRPARGGGESDSTPAVIPGGGGAGGNDGTCPPGEHPNPAGGCCPAGTTALDDGTCQPAGIPPEQCDEGFESDGNMGCNVILPPEPCPEGLMAVPGDTTCREIAPCGDGTWGDIVVEASTQYVDASYAGGDSDGTAERPWTGIQDGIGAAQAGAIVAVAAGSYHENLLIAGKPVRVWGRCPSMVEVVGSEGMTGVVFVTADHSEVHRLAITGPQLGINMTGAEHVVLEHLWIHDTDTRGLQVLSTSGTTSFVLRDSLVERSRDTGIQILGAEATIEATVVRDTQPSEGGDLGDGIAILISPSGERANVTVRSALLENNREVGLFVRASDAAIEATVVRDTQPDASGNFGRAIGIQYDKDTGERAHATIRSALLKNNHDVGLDVFYSDATIEHSVIEETLPRPSDEAYGMGSVCTNATLTVDETVVRSSHVAGVMAWGCAATVADSLIQTTHSGHFFDHDNHGNPVEKYEGVGDGLLASRGSDVTVINTRLEDCVRAGLLFDGSSGTLSEV